MKNLMTLDGKTWTLVEYHLTLEELVQIGIAYIVRFFKGGRLTDYLNADLENVLCAYVPQRHKILKLNCGEVK